MHIRASHIGRIYVQDSGNFLVCRVVIRRDFRIARVPTVHVVSPWWYGRHVLLRERRTLIVADMMRYCRYRRVAQVCDGMPIDVGRVVTCRLHLVLDAAVVLVNVSSPGIRYTGGSRLIRTNDTKYLIQGISN